MMKKKNMAVAMAAVTVASAVAPAFAAENTTKDNITVKEYASLESKIKNMIGMAYSEKAEDIITTGSTAKPGEEVYTIDVTTTGSTLKTADLPNGGKITREKELKELTKLVEESDKGTVFNFTIEDKGHAIKSDKTITNIGINKYTVKELAAENVIEGKELTLGGTKYTVEQKFDEEKLSLTVKFTPAGSSTAEYTLTLKAGENKKDFSEKGATFTNEGTKKLTGFRFLEEAIKSTTHNVTVVNAKEVAKTVTAENIKTLADELKKNYTFASDAIANAKEDIDQVGNRYETVLFAEDILLNTNTSRSARNSKITPGQVLAQIRLTADKKEDLEKLLDTVAGKAGSFNVIAGEERIDTAIELSKDAYKKDSANSVVLVSQYAVVDGLAAAPLAAEKDAPILLTDSKSLDKKVKEEMVRVLGLGNSASENNKKTVYLVGGELAISKDIELELANLGVNIKRFAGADREDTSRMIAKEMKSNTKAYVVDGYKGLADAMSISAVASKKGAEAPIVVVNGAGELNADAKSFLRGYRDADVIGGDSVITETALKDIANATGNATRIAGKDRQETNAKVISTYYKGENVKQFILAKDGYSKDGVKNDFLVDALAAAPIAGEKNAPIVLSTLGLHTDQAIAITSVKAAGEDNTLTQVGGGIASSVIESVKKFVGLK